MAFVGIASANFVTSSDPQTPNIIYTSTYHGINIADDAMNPAAYGWVEFRIRAGGSAQDLTIWLQNDDTQKDLVFNATYNPDGTAIVGQNPGFMKIKIYPQGTSEPELIDAGNWTAYLQKGNGDQLETQHFKIGGGEITFVPFLGSAVSSDARIVGVGKPIIVTSAYGYSASHTVYHPEVNHTIVTGTTPAYYTIVHSGSFTGYAKKVFDEYHHPADFDFVIGMQKYKITGHAWDEKYVFHPETTITKLIVDHIAYTETVIDGRVIDVTNEVKQAVSLGHKSFIFDNRPNPGGIFAPDGTTLLVPIIDPAYGFIKNVHIEYIGGFQPEVKTIDTKEYDLINLI
jgi:hypothetical protein